MPSPSRKTTRSRTTTTTRTTTALTGAQVNGQMARKLEDLGLNQTQIDGVLALSREVVERVVWEVVPELAEQIIRENLQELTARKGN